jgi:hypothetical protein
MYRMIVGAEKNTHQYLNIAATPVVLGIIS